jgi:hypothetical protein
VIRFALHFPDDRAQRPLFTPTALGSKNANTRDNNVHSHKKKMIRSRVNTQNRHKDGEDCTFGVQLGKLNEYQERERKGVRNEDQSHGLSF